MRAIVLAGGHGTRLRPLTFTGNKHMLPIANQPILHYALKSLAIAGIREVGIILGPIQEGICEGIGDGSAFGMRVTYIEQGDPKGLAHAVLCARDFLGTEPFLMHLGDNLLQSGVGQFVRRFEVDRPDAVVGATPVRHPENYGVVELAGDQIVSIEEKPAHPKSNLALIGVYLFTPAIHEVVTRLTPSHRGELEITEAIWRLRELGRRVAVLGVDGWWKDTGHPDDLLEANELVLRGLPAESFSRAGVVRPGAVIDGSVAIGPESVIEDGAHVIGPTVIGSRVLVGRGSHIGPATAIGNQVILQRARVRRSIVMDGARLDGVVLANSLIGRNVEIVSNPPSEREATLTLGDSSRITL